MATKGGGKGDCDCGGSGGLAGEEGEAAGGGPGGWHMLRLIMMTRGWGEGVRKVGELRRGGGVDPWEGGDVGCGGWVCGCGRW